MGAGGKGFALLQWLKPLQQHHWRRSAPCACVVTSEAGCLGGCGGTATQAVLIVELCLWCWGESGWSWARLLLVGGVVSAVLGWGCWRGCWWVMSWFLWWLVEGKREFWVQTQGKWRITEGRGWLDGLGLVLRKMGAQSVRDWRERGGASHCNYAAGWLLCFVFFSLQNNTSFPTTTRACKLNLTRIIVAIKTVVVKPNLL